jgi:hypothetical protein
MKTPGILLLVGGLLVLIVGGLVAALGSAFAMFGAGMFGAAVGALGGVQIIFGILLILSGIWAEKKGWAIIGLIISILSLITLGGLIIGPILGIIGGALGLKGTSAKKK